MDTFPEGSDLDASFIYGFICIYSIVGIFNCIFLFFDTINLIVSDFKRKY